MPAEPKAKLACLDGLRGLAVASVVLFHLRGGDASGYHPAAAALLAPFQFGFSGVSLFLVLSGFCLTYSLLRRDRAGRPPSLRSYLAARWWRIGPPYYAALAIGLLLPALSMLAGRRDGWPSTWTAHQVGTHLVLLHGLWHDTIAEISPPFWSLSLEFQFYLVLPLLYALATSERFGYRRVLAGVVAVSLAWRLALASFWPEAPHLVYGFFAGRWTEFALGMGVALWYDSAGQDRAGHAPSGRVLAAGVLASLGVAAALTCLGHRLLTDFIFGLGYALLLMAVLASARRGGRLGRVAEATPLVWIGGISYALYLIHPPVLECGVQVYRRLVARPSLATDLALLALLPSLALAAGWAFYQLVERRFVRSVDTPRNDGAGRAAVAAYAGPHRPLRRSLIETCCQETARVAMRPTSPSL